MKKYGAMDPSKFIFLDETGMHLNMTTDYARALMGQRIAMPKPFIRGNKITFIGALSLEGIEAAIYGEWSANGSILYQFLEKSLVPKLSGAHTVFMDNVSFHTSECIETLIQSTGAKLVLLPPYSPDFNPIEMMWSKIKDILKKLEPRTMKQYERAIKNAVNEVTQSNIAGWFSHSGYLLTL